MIYLEVISGDTVFAHTRNSKAYKKLEGFFSSELENITKKDEFVFPYVVDLLVRMVTPSTTYLDDDKPLSIAYFELRQARAQGFGPNETSEFFRALADEVFFSCGWTPERFERSRRPINLEFYIQYGVACYSNAAQIDWELELEDRATTLTFLANQYIDWANNVYSIKQSAEKNFELLNIWQSLIASSSLDDEQILHCIEHLISRLPDIFDAPR